MALLVLLFLLVAGPALAANTLQSVSASPLPGGKVQLTLSFSGPAVAPQAFSTNTPPRIAMDFADTSNGLAQRSYDLGQGTAQSVSAVESNGRTRVVVNLSQPSPYVTSVQGNQLLVTIGDGMDSATAVADPPQDSGTALAPGYVDTEFNHEFWTTPAGERLIKGIPQRRLGHENDLDGAIMLLASQASRYMTGSVITVDGGFLLA